MIEKATGEKKVNAVGYCVGGTLLAITLGYLAAIGDERIASATLLTAQIDFEFAGDLKVFADADHIASVEAEMKKTGYLEGSKMATAFNLLRSNDLIWPYVVNNYLKGKEPLPFDLLYWNADATRMPAANHSFYLRNCYLENNSHEGPRSTIAGQQDRPLQGRRSRSTTSPPGRITSRRRNRSSSARPSSAGRCASC